MEQAVRRGPEVELPLPGDVSAGGGADDQPAPSNLVDLAVQSHGGLERWEQYSRFRASASITGAVWSMKGVAGLLDDVVLEGEIRDQRITITPFPKLGEYATWEPSRQSIETAEGIVLQERLDPAASFVGQDRQSPWDDYRPHTSQARRTGTISSPRSSSLARISSLRRSSRGTRTVRSGGGSSSPTPRGSWRTAASRPTTSMTPGC